MNRIQWICFIANLLIQFQCDAMRSMIPINFQQEPAPTDQRATNNITGYINIKIGDIMDSLSTQRKETSRTRNAHHAISKRLNHSEFAILGSLDSLGRSAMESKQKEQTLVKQKRTMDVIKLIERYFEPSSSQAADGKDVVKLINSLLKDDCGMNNTDIVVSKRSGPATLRIADQTYDIVDSRFFRRGMMPIVQQIRTIIERNYGQSMEDIGRDYALSIATLQQVSQQLKKDQLIRAQFSALETQRQHIESQLQELNKSLQNDTQRVRLKLDERDRIQSEKDFNFHDHFETSKFATDYFDLKDRILVEQQQCIKYKQNQSLFAECLQKIRDLRRELASQQPRMQSMICQHYCVGLIDQVPDLLGVLNLSLENYKFTMNPTTLEETITYKVPLVALTRNPNTHVGHSVRISPASFRDYTPELLNKTLAIYAYCNGRGYSLYHSLNQAHQFVRNMNKLNAFWSNYAMIIKPLDVWAHDDAINPNGTWDADAMYLGLRQINSEFAPLLSWLDVFNVGWNDDENGIKVLMYFVEITRQNKNWGIRKPKDKMMYTDIRQRMLFWSDIGVTVKLPNIDMDNSKFDKERRWVVIWWNLMRWLQFSF
eukprot:137972_1